MSAPLPKPMGLGRLLWAGLRHRRRPAGLTALSLGLSAALLGLGLHAARAVAARTRPPPALAGIVVGPPGDPLPLALCGAWLLTPCRGLLPAGALAAVEAEPSAQRVIPFATGDAVAGLPVIATVAEAFASGPGAPGLLLAAGAPLPTPRADLSPWLGGGPPPAAAPALVLGQGAARRLGLGLGAAAALAHGAAGPAHGEAWPVIGLLAPTGTAVDDVIFADLGAYVALEDHQGGARGVSGAWVRPRGGVHKAILRARLGALPGISHADVLVERQRLADALGLGAWALGAGAAALLLVVGLGAAAAGAAAAEGRRRELALLVVLGARRPQLLTLLVGEGAVIGLGAGLGGALAARAAWATGAALSPAGLVPAAAASPLIELTLGLLFSGISALAVLPTAWGAAEARPHDELGAAG